jgi:tetratricopeptide (TPR) repeat protein
VSLAVHGLGLLAQMRADHAQARSRFTESLAIRRELGDETGAAMSLHSLGITVLAEGNPDAAGSLLENSLAAFRKVDYQWSIAAVTIDLGYLARLRGDTGTARKLIEEGLARHRECESLLGIGIALRMRGLVCQDEGHLAEARHLMQESLFVLSSTKHASASLSTLQCLAAVLHRQGRREQSALLFGAGEALTPAIGRSTSPSDHESCHQRALAKRSGQGDLAFEAAWKAGRAMSLEKAVNYALSLQ